MDNGFERPKARAALRILMLASNNPQRIGTGSSMRTYHFARALSQLGELTLGLFSPSEEFARNSIDFPAEIIGPSAPRLNRARSRSDGWRDAISVVLMPWRKQWSGLLRYIVATGNERSGRRGMTRNALSTVVRAEFAIANRYFNPMPLMTFWQRDSFEAIRREVKHEMRRCRFDILWFEHGFNFPLVQELLESIDPTTLIVCNTHNMEFHLAKQFEPASDDPTSVSDWQLQSATLRRVESRAFKTSDLVVVCSDKDKELALGLAPAATVETAENGVDTDYFRPGTSIAKANVPTVLFTGLFTYPPNIDAAKFLVLEILPLVRESIPDCRVVFAGRNAGPALEKLIEGLEGLECVTNPEDMRQQFERAWIFSAPVRMGGGTRLKILEAMAMECPVVSTTIGAEGMPYVHGKHILIADGASAFAAEVVRLIRDSQLREVISRDAATLVRQKYDWSDVAAKAIRRIERLLDAKHAS
jgi:glycosyltransferase involved in cell wall biosynthesis